MQEYAESLKNPEPGDLIFMGNEAVVTHIALFVRKDDGISIDTLTIITS